MQKSFRYPGANYPAGRPQFFAIHYQRRLLREGVLMRLPPLAFAFLTKVVLEEDRRRYESPATLFNEDISAALGCSRDTLRRTRDELVASGLLHYERPADKEAGVYWVREMDGWEPLRRNDVESEGFYRRRDAPVTAQATAPGSAPVTAPPSFPKEDPNPPPPEPDPWEAVVAGLREVGVLSPAGSAADARRNGFTPELALACVAFVLQPDTRTAIGPGAVVKRFRNPEANRWPANQNWPPVSSQAQLLRDREREAERAAQARHPAEGYHTDAPPEFVEALADHLGVDIVRQWSLDRSFLELLTTAQLQELAAEWKLQPAATKRGELVEWLADAGKEKPCPKSVRGIKAVSLT